MKYFGEAHTLLYVKDKNTVALIKPVIEKFFNDWVSIKYVAKKQAKRLKFSDGLAIPEGSKYIISIIPKRHEDESEAAQKYVYVAESRLCKCQYGLFANRRFKKDERISPYLGRLLKKQDVPPNAIGRRVYTWNELIVIPSYRSMYFGMHHMQYADSSLLNAYLDANGYVIAYKENKPNEEILLALRNTVII